MATIFQMIGASFVLVQLVMVFLWLVYIKQRNAGIVDLGWVAGFFLSMVAYIFFGEGNFLKSLILLIMVGLWSGQLGYYIYQRYMSSDEDPRYAELREKWGEENTDTKFLMLFTFQGVLVTVLSLPFILVACCPNSEWTSWEILGVLVWGIGVTGEYLAGKQLSDFKKSGQSGVCNAGLWKCSRHPNYFFEFIVWIGFALFAFSSTFGILAFISPALIYYILRYGTGVPLTEAHLVRSKGEEYIRYQNRTNEFFPWFPGKEASK